MTRTRLFDAKHAVDRAMERYGIGLDAAALDALEARLSAGEGMILRRQPDGSDVRVVRVAEQLVTVVCFKGQIITFLSADAPIRKKWQPSKAGPLPTRPKHP